MKDSLILGSGERDDITACVGVNEGHFTLIISTSSYVNPNVTQMGLHARLWQVLLPLVASGPNGTNI